MPRKNKAQTDQKWFEKQRESDPPVCWIKPGERLRVGMTCPRCQTGKLDYNGLLQLTCPICGLTEAGACT
jgi:uncharacterized protein (DUF983 family)